MIRPESIERDPIEIRDCDVCAFVTINHNDLSEHLTTEHVVLIKPQCQRCKAIFRSQRKLKEHLIYCGLTEDQKYYKRPYKCNFCPYRAARSWSLRIHNRAYHETGGRERNKSYL